MQTAQALIKINLDLSRLLHAGAIARTRNFARAAFAPTVDHLRCHFNVTLHAEAIAQRERLMYAMRTR